MIVLEAGSTVGGRVAQLHGFAPWPLQLGAEFVHGGENNVLVRLFERLRWSYRTLEWPDRYYFGTRRDTENDDDDDTNTKREHETTTRRDESLRGMVDAETAEAHPDVAEAHRLLADLPETPWVLTDAEDSNTQKKNPSQISIDDLECASTKHVDCTALEWLTDRVKASKRVVAVAENVYANDFGCSLSTMGLRETAVEQREWCHGEEYILLDKGRHLGNLTAEIGKGLDVRLNTVASKVERRWKQTRSEGETESENGAKTVVTTRCGKSFRASAAIVVAAPVSALKESHWSPAFATKLAFDPPLPRAKRDAIESIQMSDAVKICLAFSERFWPEDVWNVVCCDAFLPECWMLEYETEDDGGAGDDVAGRAIVTFFACGETAKAVARRIREDPEGGEAGVVHQALAQLDAMFGGEKKAGGDAAKLAAPASNAFVAAKTFPWSAVASVGGAYTHPSVYAAGARRELRKPAYEGALFFAGEAANVKCNPCMQGAMTTGLEAAAAAAAARAARTGTPLPDGFGQEDWFVEGFGSDD